jgi:hypothetical protein
MFRISSEIGMFPVREAGEEVTSFVYSLGFLAHGGKQKAADESQQSKNKEAGGSRAHCHRRCKRYFRHDLLFLLDPVRGESDCFAL